MRAHLPLRLIRTTAFAAVCVLLAALAHWLSGGARPEPWALTAGVLAVFASAAALSGRERSPAQVACLLVAAQLGLHELFGGDGTGYVAAHLHGQGLGEALGMLTAHLTATLLTGWWLARGESALWALLRRLARRLLFPRPAPAPAAARPLAPVVRARAVPPDPALRHSLARRGPPLPA
ncbi:MFS transporter [Nonomuraea sp. MCN248]|uniref:MFS transporter n=1 Tax=Nonomuraea corallina TaxID=2989783 RepID=A0ABT4S4H5_9ACTN|nr:MFS transporter [Nonomuraea corallina]MDA0632102.1 MFS transporter [Nonomuraea corallina]